MKKVFVHIPKTAGTFINSSLAAAGKRVLVHCESCIDSPDFLNYICQHEWISGHVPSYKFKERFSSLNVDAEFYTVLRNPIRQLISQICWQIEICAKAEDNHSFLKQHPEESILRILSVLFSDLTDESSLDNLLSRNSGYLTNNQTITLMAEYAIDLSFQALNNGNRLSYLCHFYQQCRAMINTFTFIGSDLDMENVLFNFGILDSSVADNVERNESRLYLNPDLLQTPQCIKMLINHQLLDCILYLSYVELSTSANSQILNTSSLVHLYSSIYEYFSSSLNYPSNTYEPQKISLIQQSLVNSFKK